MLANLLELLGFAAVTLAAYEWSGRVLALLVGGVLLWFIAQGLAGVKIPGPLTRLRRARNAVAARMAKRKRQAL